MLAEIGYAEGIVLHWVQSSGNEPFCIRTGFFLFCCRRRAVSSRGADYLQRNSCSAALLCKMWAISCFNQLWPSKMRFRLENIRLGASLGIRITPLS